MSVVHLRDPLVPTALQCCVAINAGGVPRFWATIYDLTDLSALAEGSRRRTLAGIDAFYVRVEVMYGADVLDRLLVTLDIDSVSHALEAFLLREQNLAAFEQRGVGGRWHAASRFVLSTLRNIAAARGLLQEIGSLRQRLQDLERRIGRLEFPPAPHERTIRALPAAVLQDLYEIFDPRSERNPFRSEVERFRNFTLFHVLLHCGLRAGEALLLPVDCVRSQHDPNLVRDRHWITVRNMFDDGTETDRRALAPSLKNTYALRQIPVTDRVAALIRDFTSMFRRPSSDTEALFVSNRGRPLSQRMLELVMARANAALSRTAHDLLVDQRGNKQAKFTAHDLRRHPSKRAVQARSSRGR
ncbi:site-specific integrase [Lamprobacter modestohalophilus]|uniref:site-specific integrase n=1 Tax=Lamprobacter modestohalophilus TaxID=1064514 RepID=UPI002ADEE72E|nr:site-specific integrase [Lamprobacter modestohalophilus]MEA1053264.1 site-specific integrase [Lamprobacter modestohalophilus]